MTWLDTHAGDLEVASHLLVEIAFPTATLRLSSSDVTLYTPAPENAGQAPEDSWIPAGFEVSGVDASLGTAGGQATLALGNGDDALSALVHAADLGGAKVRAWWGYLDPDVDETNVVDSIEIARGRVEQPDLDDLRLTLTLGAMNDFQRVTMPRRRWRYPELV